MDKDNINTKMEIILMVNGFLIKKKVLEYLNSSMVTLMKANGNKEEWMVKDKCLFKMDISK